MIAGSFKRKAMPSADEDLNRRIVEVRGADNRVARSSEIN